MFLIFRRFWDHLTATAGDLQSCKECFWTPPAFFLPSFFELLRLCPRLALQVFATKDLILGRNKRAEAEVFLNVGYYHKYIMFNAHILAQSWYGSMYNFNVLCNLPLYYCKNVFFLNLSFSSSVCLYRCLFHSLCLFAFKLKCLFSFLSLFVFMFASFIIFLCLSALTYSSSILFFSLFLSYFF